MKTFTITESKARWSALVEQVSSTKKPIVIGRAGKPLVQLVPYEPGNPSGRIGCHEGKIELADDFDEWGEEESEAWIAPA
jgi:prevent-host-death family protein